MPHALLPRSLARSLHRQRPSARVAKASVLRPRFSRPGPSRPFPHRRQRINRRNRYVVEALAAGLATALLSGVAVTFPAVLRQSPLTTAQSLAGLIVPSMASSAPSVLIDCP